MINSRNIAIIPARAGSKRVPGKNIRLIEGKPLIAYSIITGLNNHLIDEVYVSTDSDEIAEISRKFGAKILNRPVELSGDYTPTSDVIQYHVDSFSKKEPEIKWVFILQPTNPVRPKGLISNVLRVAETEDRGSVACFSPLEKKFGRIESNKFIPESYSFGERSQYIQDRFYENGLLYLVKAELARKGVIMSKDVYPFVVDSIHGTVDIDTVKDFEYAQLVMQFVKQKNLE